MNVCCVCSCIPSQYWKWLKMYLKVNNGAKFGITVIWSVVVLYTVVITVACGLAVTWHCNVCKFVCCCIVVDIRRSLSEKKNGKYLLYIYLLICFICLFVCKCFCTERKLILLLITKYYQFQMSNCRKSSHSPSPCSVLNIKDFSPH